MPTGGTTNLRSSGQARLRVAGDYASATLDDGSEVQLTRSEARVLQHLVRHAGHAVSRDTLLDEVGGADAERGDRSIDFIVTRLRRKLGDNARNPRFIGTRYGEGYVWLAEVIPALDVRNAHILIGPIRGVEQIGDAAKAGLDFARHIHAALRSDVDPEKLILWAPDVDGPDPFAPEAPEITIDFAFFSGEEGAECVVTARARQSGAVVHASRHQLADDPVTAAALIRSARQIAGAILLQDWTARATQAAKALPLPMAAHVATGMPKSGTRAWAPTYERLLAWRREDPENPEVKLMLAAHLHTKYVLKGSELFQHGEATCNQDQAEIERLVLEALDFAQTSPNHAITAGKLLYFADPGYRDLAIELMETAHRTHTVAAVSLAMLGQMRAFIGQAGSGTGCLHQAAQLCPKGGEFEAYILVLLCQALLADGDRDGLRKARRRLYQVVPTGVFFFAPLLSDTDSPSLRAKAATLMLSPSRARGLLMNLHYISTRLFADPQRGANIIRPPLTLFRKRFGPAVVPDAVRRHFQGLI